MAHLSQRELEDLAVTTRAILNSVQELETSLRRARQQPDFDYSMELVIRNLAFLAECAKQARDIAIRADAR